MTENAPPVTAEPAARLGGITLPAFLSAFAYRNFRLIWTGAFLSSIGTWTQDVALAWLIHTRMHDPFYLGLRAFASAVLMNALCASISSLNAWWSA